MPLRVFEISLIQRYACMCPVVKENRLASGCAEGLEQTCVGDRSRVPIRCLRLWTESAGRVSVALPRGDSGAVLHHQRRDDSSEVDRQSGSQCAGTTAIGKAVSRAVGPQLAEIV
jgi:hypothetical protein